MDSNQTTTELQIERLREALRYIDAEERRLNLEFDRLVATRYAIQDMIDELEAQSPPLVVAEQWKESRSIAGENYVNIGVLPKTPLDEADLRRRIERDVPPDWSAYITIDREGGTRYKVWKNEPDAQEELMQRSRAVVIVRKMRPNAQISDYGFAAGLVDGRKEWTADITPEHRSYLAYLDFLAPSAYPVSPDVWGQTSPWHWSHVTEAKKLSDELGLPSHIFFTHRYVGKGEHHFSPMPLDKWKDMLEQYKPLCDGFFHWHADDYYRRVAMLGLADDEKTKATAKYLKENGLDDDGNWEEWKAQNLPQYVKTMQEVAVT